MAKQNKRNGICMGLRGRPSRGRVSPRRETGLGETGLRGAARSVLTAFRQLLAERWGSSVCILAVLGLLGYGQVSGADDEPASAGVSLFDSGTSSAQPLSTGALHAKAGWLRLPEDETAHTFRGDAVLLNDRLAVVLRSKAAGFDVFSVTPAGCRQRTTLIPLAVGGAAPAALSGVTILENNSAAVRLEAVFAAAAGVPMSLQCQLSVGQSILEIRPIVGVARLRLLHGARYVVIPDFFGDDMVFTPDSLVRDRMILPAENFFFTPLDGGAALLMCVSSARMQNAEALIARSSEQRSFAGCEVDCAAGKNIWLASIDGAGLWHDRPLPAADLQAAFVLDWKPPFPAKWRADFLAEAGESRSWYFLGGEGPGDEVLVAAAQGCPCRIEGQRAVVDGPLVAAGVSELPPRPLLVYPMDRSRATPLTAFCPTDVLRNTLGVGPCQYILQTEGLQSDANPTPDNVMTWIEKQIARKRQKKSADEIRDLVQQMVEHVGHVAERIQRYADLGRAVQKLCAEGEASDALRTAAAVLKPIAVGLQRQATAADVTAVPQRVGQLAVQVAALVDQTNPLVECQRLGAELRSAGAAQDRALANGRMAARWLRARAKMLAADDRSAAEWVRKIQDLVDAALDDKR